jgi:hypothetical protein
MERTVGTLAIETNNHPLLSKKTCKQPIYTHVANRDIKNPYFY